MDQQNISRMPIYQITSNSHQFYQGKYQIINQLGSDPSSCVFKVKRIDSLDQNEYAIKIVDQINPSQISISYDIMQKTYAGQIRNFVKIYAVEYQHPFLIILMELCQGEELLRFYNDNELSQTQILEIAYSLALGIQELHNQKILHRDLKPENIMVLNNNGILTTKLINLAISKKLEKTQILATQKIGTAYYMAPELIIPQLSSKISFGTDIFAFGLILYECQTKEPLFNGIDEEDILDKIMNQFDQHINQIHENIPKKSYPLLNELIIGMTKYKIEERLRIQSIIQKLEQYLSVDKKFQNLQTLDIQLKLKPEEQQLNKQQVQETEQLTQKPIEQLTKKNKIKIQSKNQLAEVQPSQQLVTQINKYPQNLPTKEIQNNQLQSNTIQIFEQEKFRNQLKEILELNQLKQFLQKYLEQFENFNLQTEMIQLKKQIKMQFQSLSDDELEIQIGVAQYKLKEDLRDWKKELVVIQEVAERKNFQ